MLATAVVFAKLVHALGLPLSKSLLHASCWDLGQRLAREVAAMTSDPQAFVFVVELLLAAQLYLLVSGEKSL
jgi:hypothetical protein